MVWFVFASEIWCIKITYLTNMHHNSRWSSFITKAITCRLTCISQSEKRLYIKVDFLRFPGVRCYIRMAAYQYIKCCCGDKTVENSLVSTIAFQMSVGGYLFIGMAPGYQYIRYSLGPLQKSTVIETGDIKGKWLVVRNTGICHDILFDTWDRFT